MSNVDDQPRTNDKVPMTGKRHVAGPFAGLLLSLLGGGLLLFAATIDLFVVDSVRPNDPLPVSVRIPLVGVYQGTVTGGASYRLMRINQRRGETISPRRARLIRAYEETRRPPSTGLLFGLGLAGVLIFYLFTSYLRVLGTEVRFLRPQAVLVGSIVVLMLGVKVALVFTVWSALWAPLVALVVPVALHLGRRVAAATSIAAAVALSLLTPIDLVLLIVMISQGLAISATLRPHGRMRSAIGGTLLSAVAGLLAYTAVSLLLRQYVQIGQLRLGALEAGVLLESDLVASLASPLVSGLLSFGMAPAIQRLLCHVPRSRLSALADFEHPLLRQLAARAPGTWAHSLSMANMAEMAANAIHANGLLVRVGAYYHDVGKSTQPDYFIENQADENPHDKLDPEVSADAIVSHVAQGQKLARKHKLPEAVVEFIYTHHGTDRLEYFWHKRLKATGEDERAKISETDFRYRGLRPQTRETAILALCDAVEAAARTMESNEPKAIRQLVRQIVFTKVLGGVLDQSGLTIAELRSVTESMIDTLRSSMHKRVKYPWQERKESSPTGPTPDAKQEHPQDDDASNQSDRDALANNNALTQSQRLTRQRGYTRPLGINSEGSPDADQ